MDDDFKRPAAFFASSEAQDLAAAVLDLIRAEMARETARLNAPWSPILTTEELIREESNAYHHAAQALYDLVHPPAHQIIAAEAEEG